VSIQNVEKQVWLITGQCKAKDSLYRMSMNESGPPHVAIPLASDIRTTVEVENIERLPLFDIHNEQVELLRALYQSQDETGKKTIIDTCQLVWFNSDCTSQVFAFLARYCSLQKAVQFVTASSQPFLWLAANPHARGYERRSTNCKKHCNRNWIVDYEATSTALPNVMTRSIWRRLAARALSCIAITALLIESEMVSALSACFLAASANVWVSIELL
jgi:hypothetical protein